MKTIIIERNKNHFKRIVIIILMFFCLYILSKFLINPSEHTYFLLPTKNSVIVFSVVGIFASILVLYIIVKNIFNNDAVLRIDNEGIFNSFFLYHKKNIKWEEISKIETIKHNNNNYIGIFLKEIINDEKGINSLFFKLNVMTMGTPYVIYSGDLSCSFEELKQLILESYNQSKQILN